MTIDEALNRLITRAATLINSIGDAQDHFADEFSELKIAMSDAQDALAVAYKAGQTAGSVKLPQFPQQTAYHISFLAPAGVYRDLAVADTPDQALRKAMQFSESKEFKPAFDPDQNALSIYKIIIQHPDSDAEQAVWTDPDMIAHLHADEILGLLEELIGSIEDAGEARSQLDDDIATIETTARDASLALDRLRKKGGAQ
jgi:hypothetical protein